MRPFRYLLFLASLFFLHACGEDDTQKNDRLLAKVYDKTLYLSDTEGLFPEGTTGGDSSLIINAYAQRWIHDQLLMYEAERNIPQDLNIDELVRDYRASLVKFNFEESIIATKMDSAVGEEELKQFYENNKDQFELKTTILKCLLLKIPTAGPVSEINKLWNSNNPNDKALLLEKAGQFAVVAKLDPEQWYRLDEIAAFLPQGTLTAENVGSRKDGSLSEEGFRFYYRVLKVVSGKETAPFEYVREQANKVILHKRKQQLLDKWKEDLYQKELRRNNVKIFK